MPIRQYACGSITFTTIFATFQLISIKHYWLASGFTFIIFITRCVVWFLDDTCCVFSKLFVLCFRLLILCYHVLQVIIEHHFTLCLLCFVASSYAVIWIWSYHICIVPVSSLNVLAHLILYAKSIYKFVSALSSNPDAVCTYDIQYFLVRNYFNERFLCRFTNSMFGNNLQHNGKRTTQGKWNHGNLVLWL